MALSYLKNILQLILAPSQGWEDVAASTRDTQSLVKHLMFPLMALAALSVYIQMFYDLDTHFAPETIKCVVVFVSLFLTYFFAQVMFRRFIYNMCDTEPSDKKITIVLAYTMSLLSLSTIFCNIVPVNLGLRYLLPLVVAMIVWKSEIYLTVKGDKDFAFIFFILFTTIIPPILIQQLFDRIL